MAISKVTSASITTNAVGPTQLNEASNYDFTGTVTGAGGITQADLWRFTSTTTTNNTRTLISSNLERSDDPSFGYIGSGMSQSSGVFTFPETGIYFVEAQYVYYASSSNMRYAIAIIEATTNNSTYDHIAFGRSYLTHNYGTTYLTSRASSYVDVTNTSNVKVQFRTQTEATYDTMTLGGETDYNSTYFTFIRLGDT